MSNQDPVSYLTRALTIREKVLEPEHPYIATGLNNLALLYHDQGKYSEAEPLYQRALAILEKVYSLEHPNVAAALENYADLLRATKREDEAARLEERARASRAKHARETQLKVSRGGCVFCMGTGQSISKNEPSGFVILSDSEESLAQQRFFAIAQNDSLGTASFDSQPVLFEIYWAQDLSLLCYETAWQGRSSIVGAGLAPALG